MSSLHVFAAVSSPATFLNLFKGGVDLSNSGGGLDLGLFWEPQGYVTLKIIGNLHNGDPGFRKRVDVMIAPTGEQGVVFVLFCYLFMSLFVR